MEITLAINIKDREITLDLEEALELYEKLSELFNKTNIGNWYWNPSNIYDASFVSLDK